MPFITCLLTISAIIEITQVAVTRSIAIIQSCGTSLWNVCVLGRHYACRWLSFRSRFYFGKGFGGKSSSKSTSDRAIAEDPILRDTKIIAEAWDAGGAYQVGSFPGGRWAEWNDRYRDDVRRYWRGDQGFTSLLATRITGSSDIYLKNGKRPFHSINFVTSHDGFTMNDLVSYSQKHNEANGEDNRDGIGENFSSNYGTEGPSDVVFIEEVRNRQIKNFFATLLLSIGTPMILGGDEFRRTQQGNNNAYCHDNEITWYDWSFLKKHRDVYDFVKQLIAFRKTIQPLGARIF